MQSRSAKKWRTLMTAITKRLGLCFVGVISCVARWRIGMIKTLLWLWSVAALESVSKLHFLVQCFNLESISEDAVATDKKHNVLTNFVPTLRSGEWSDIGGRAYMEDTHICIADLAKNFGCNLMSEEPVSFYGVFDGHGGKGASHFVRDHLPRVIVEDAGFPLELEKAVTRSFMATDAAFAKSCSLESALVSGTTVLTAIILGRSLLVANAGDCRAVLSRHGTAIEMSKDHRPCCMKEKRRIESLGGFIDDGYLNGQLGVTRALGDWHLEGMKETGERVGPLSAEPELKMMTLTKEDEFLIIGSDGIWDVFTSQNAIDFARRRLQEHNDVKLCCKEIVEEGMKRGATDNLTVVLVSFHLEPPPSSVIQRARVRRSISAEGLQSLKCLLEG
ncbi:probable protein phosphatase 2C 27 isoform X1 [Herrania umbratica]|uniref:protein-serine/threonine phosphatase n=1 Tax=Herrania umbratica TaxID=108875 RepID=A0A6J0ZTH7_9ROSI|nr:probable protein phosphatase 2C 27 isoform X1 [Herrania umbratica]